MASVLLISFVGCNASKDYNDAPTTNGLEEKYNLAVIKLKDEDYSTAKKLFFECGDYMDSVDYFKKIKALPTVERIHEDDTDTIIKTKYDNYGNSIRTEYDYYDGSYVTYDRKYDENNNKIEEKYESLFAYNGEAHKVNTLTQYTYNEKNLCVKEVTISSSTSGTQKYYEYDENGRKIKEIEINSNGEDITEYINNEYGDCIQEICNWANGNSKTYETTYEYDEKGRVIMSHRLYGDEYEYVYNIYDELISETWTTASGKYKYKYDYDNSGICIKKTIISPNNEIDTIEYSDFQYYYYGN